MPDLPTGTVTFLFTDIEGLRLPQSLRSLCRGARRTSAHFRSAFEEVGGRESIRRAIAFGCRDTPRGNDPFRWLRSRVSRVGSALRPLLRMTQQDYSPASCGLA